MTALKQALRLCVLTRLSREIYQQRPNFRSWWKFGPVGLQTSLPAARGGVSTTSTGQSRSFTIEDSEKVMYIDATDGKTDLTFGELRRLASEQKADKDRDLIRVFLGGRTERLKTFKLMSTRELETAVRKARHLKTKVVHERVEVDPSAPTTTVTVLGDRVHEKQLKISSNVSGHDLEVAIRRVRKWLGKGLYVRLAIMSAAGTDKRGAGELADAISRRCADLLEEKGDLLTVTVH